MMLRPILLVEDNPNDLDLTRRAFLRRRASLPLQEAHDGAEALDLMTGWQNGEKMPALVLLDLRLPKVNGMEVLRRIKADPRTSSVPVVVLTSSSEPKDIQDAYDLGANSYLVKPGNYREFSAMAANIDAYWTEVNVSLE
jgi:CheY-like chemotaxis protein